MLGPESKKIRNEKPSMDCKKERIKNLKFDWIAGLDPIFSQIKIKVSGILDKKYPYI